MLDRLQLAAYVGKRVCRQGRTTTILVRLAVCLVTFVVGLAPLVATASPGRVPKLLDPIGDANYLNDGGYSNHHGTPFVGNLVTRPDLDDASDLAAVWFTNDASTITLNIQTEAMPEYEGVTRYYWVNANPERTQPDSPDCLLWVVLLGDQSASLTTNHARVIDLCQDDYTGIPAELRTAQMIDGSGLITIEVPRSYSERFGPGRSIDQPWARSAMGDPWNRLIDTTVRGADYKIAR